MPVVVMHGGGGGGYISGGKNARPSSHLCLSIAATLVNPIFGLNHALSRYFLLIHACASEFYSPKQLGVIHKGRPHEGGRWGMAQCEKSDQGSIYSLYFCGRPLWMITLPVYLQGGPE